MQKEDKLYAQSRKLVNAFKFDDQVASVFDDMIKRSVPGYPMMLDMLGVLTEQITTSNALCYDLGCSLGASTLAIRHNLAESGTIKAIDNSEAMISHCRRAILNDAFHAHVDVLLADITDISFEPCQLVSMNLTLQFIPKENRLTLLKDIANAIQPGGALFLSEKLKFDDEDQQSKLTDLHHQFKKHQGYSDLEIAQKRSAIENVLIPETLEEHTERLFSAGFSKVIVALQCFNFVSLIAYK